MIILLPIFITLIGILFLDQYSNTLIARELSGLRRQAETLAIMINKLERDSERVIRRSLSKESIELLLPLAGRNNQVRIRLFQPNGKLYADTKSLSQLSPKVQVLRLPRLNQDFSLLENISKFLNKIFNISNINNKYPLYQEYLNDSAINYTEVLTALNGSNSEAVRQDRNGKLILSVAVPVGNERRFRGAIMLSMDGKIIQDDISELQYSFINIFSIVIILTVFLAFIFSKRITLPISRLAKAADDVRNKKNMEIKNLINRRDEIGELAYSLDAMTKDLLNRMEYIDTFAADVSHEIKNPLTSLKSAVETISIGKVDEKKKKKLMDIALEDIDRLDKLITDISSASRLDFDLSKVEMISLNLTSLINGFINIRKETIKGVHFKLNLEKDLLIFGDQLKLIRVFENLINNAISFSPKGGEIKIDALKIKEKTHVIISDQGRGISEGKKDTIFDRFYSDRPSNERFGKHSGLGLSMVKQILESHKAKIYAENIYGRKNEIKGAKFTIKFYLY